MTPHIKILNRAASGNLPKAIDKNCEIDIEAFKELYKSGLMVAINASADDGECYLEPKISTAGREYLERTNEKNQPWWKSIDRRFYVLTIFIALLAIAIPLYLAKAT
ncbi:hypothetical protein [Janthinobacterium sp. B9-8]|uniref:hypothetical protein n=1 Tax=Janthinobacterium sp. B9-8 TaxID=1236179 RepID=UPI00061D17B4|nr:hypothetical protein [Janthinobacterium sp. B9-8]AMC35359.1 hypothetical protein VN23_12430 [Janthinobacterium sp. B9-8]